MEEKIGKSCLALRYEAFLSREFKSTSNRGLEVSFMEWIDFAEQSLEYGFHSIVIKVHGMRYKTELVKTHNYASPNILKQMPKQLSASTMWKLLKRDSRNVPLHLMVYILDTAEAFLHLISSLREEYADCHQHNGGSLIEFVPLILGLLVQRRGGI